MTPAAAVRRSAVWHTTIRLAGWAARWPLGLAALLCAAAWTMTLFGTLLIDATEYKDVSVAGGSIHVLHNGGKPFISLSSDPGRMRQLFAIRGHGVSWVAKRDAGWTFSWRRFFSLPSYAPPPPRRISTGKADIVFDPNWSCSIPLWIPFVCAAIPCGLAWRSHILARRRIRKGGCSMCGYSRAGIATIAPCPECGEPAPKSAIPNPKSAIP